MKTLRRKVGIILVVEKMVECCLMWFEPVWKRLVEAPVRRIDLMDGRPVVKGIEGQQENL